MELTDSPYVYVFLPGALVSSLYHQKNVRFDSIPLLCFVTVSFFWAPQKTTTTLYNMFFSTFEQFEILHPFHIFHGQSKHTQNLNILNTDLSSNT